LKKHLKKTWAIAIALMLALTACGVGGADTGSTPAPAAGGGDAAGGGENLPTYNFIWAHMFAGNHHIHTGIIEPLVEELRERSGGRINIEVIPGGAISTNASALDDVASGSVDFVWSQPGNNPGRFLLTEMLEFPEHFTSAEEATSVFWDLFESNEALQQEHSEYKLIAFFTTETGNIYNRTRPVTSPADTVGLLLRTPSPMTERTLQAYGASTVNMPMGDTYDNIDRGIVDGAGSNHSGVAQFSLYEVVNFATHGLNLYVSPMYFAMSWNAWNNLHPEDQALITEVTQRGLSMRGAIQYDNFAVQGLERIEAAGVEVHRLTDEERAAFFELGLSVVDAHIAAVEGQGLPGQAFHDQLIAARDARR